MVFHRLKKSLTLWLHSQGKTRKRCWDISKKNDNMYPSRHIGHNYPRGSAWDKARRASEIHQPLQMTIKIPPSTYRISKNPRCTKEDPSPRCRSTSTLSRIQQRSHIRSRQSEAEHITNQKPDPSDQPSIKSLRQYIQEREIDTNLRPTARFN